MPRLMHRAFLFPRKHRTRLEHKCRCISACPLETNLLFGLSREELRSDVTVSVTGKKNTKE
jgi:hypothetical protein